MIQQRGSMEYTESAVTEFAEKESPAVRPPMKILLVDDNEDNLFSIQTALEPLGEELMLASSGKQALRFCLDNEFAAILLDVRMPEMDGFETAECIRARKRSKHTPLLFITGYRSDEQLFRGYDLGAVDFLFRPIVPEILQSKVRAFVELSRNTQLLLRQTEALAKAEQRFRSVLEAAPDAMVITRQDGTILLANTRADVLFGYRRERLIGQNIRLLVPEWMPVCELDSDAAEGTQSCGAMFRLPGISSDGVEFPVEMTCSPLSADNEALVTTAIRDVSERVQAEEKIRRLNEDLERRVIERTAALTSTNLALLESEDKLRLALDAAKMGTWNWNPSTGELACSERTCEMFGLPFGSPLTHESILSVVHPDDRERVNREIRSALERSGNYDVQMRVPLPGESLRWVALTGQAFHNQHGAPVLMAGMAQEITERKLTEQVLFRTERLASMGRMAATIAHEINNPLEAVTNAVFLAQIAPDLPDSVRPHLENADTELKRIAHITRQTLGFYRDSTARASFPVASLLNSVFELLKSKIKHRKVEVRIECSENLHLNASYGEMRQVFSNLLANSMDAVGESGTIKVRASTAYSIREDQHHLKITFSDNGCGIDSATLPHIFAPLFTTKEALGTGLGLWVSKQIVEKHGGSIRVRSSMEAAHKGTSFMILVPDGANIVADVTAKTVT